MDGRVTYAIPEYNTMSMEAIHHAQEQFLPGQLRYCYDNSEFYKKKIR